MQKHYILSFSYFCSIQYEGKSYYSNLLYNKFYLRHFSWKNITEKKQSESVYEKEIERGREITLLQRWKVHDKLSYPTRYILVLISKFSLFFRRRMNWLINFVKHVMICLSNAQNTPLRIMMIWWSFCKIFFKISFIF